MTRPEAESGLRQRIDALAIEVGEEADEYGVTRLRLERTGRFELEHAGGHDEKRRKPITGDARELLDKPVEELFDRAEQIRWHRAFPPRPGIPNEAVVEWRVRTAEREETVRMWLRDAERDAEVAELFADLRTVVDKGSGGELFL
jgi:hypothetical protein